MNNTINDTRIVYCHYCVGSHIMFDGKLENSLKFGISIGCKNIQFFLGNPRSFKRSELTKDDIKICQSVSDYYDIGIFSHFPYVANLCGSRDILAWNGDKKTDDKLNIILSGLERELYILSHFKKSGVVIHPGTYKDKTNDIGLKTIAKSINKINFAPNSLLLLENSAGQGNSLFTSFREFKIILENVDCEKRKHIAVCIDTAHIQGVGKYDLSKKSGIDKMFSEFDEIIGKDKFKLLHLNDSKVSLGKRVDAHEFICEGKIFGNENGVDTLKYLLKILEERNIPSVLETTPHDMKKIFLL